ncbi:MAG: hypothetical protein JRE43_08135 [Deltaproteobacteria bacterium]|jgi:S-methylmethionine-dependent homocysteine/selenocysteine methylase|nr:hypothetical protein [Deltaproteobacteria bacterium]MBW2541123.1 hypothetical protein [Deltaproteobacteria bacterium]
MAGYRDALPQLNGDWFLTDGGIETTRVFHRGIDLPAFASFPLTNVNILGGCCGTDERQVDAIFQACRAD